MSSDKQLAPNTPNGLFAFTLNPNNFVDAVKLETDFKSILSHYYHWRYGSKWRKLKHIQVPFQGIIEKQSNGINHIHITIYQYNVEELALFIGYIIKMFKSLYFKASYKIKKIYNIDGWHNYTSPLLFNSSSVKPISFNFCIILFCCSSEYKYSSEKTVFSDASITSFWSFFKLNNTI